MEVYIEWVFLENFALDFILLRLAICAGREKVRWKNVCLGALVGGVFSLLYPLFILPVWMRAFVKIAVGGSMCALAFGTLKAKNQWGRYAFTVLCFFLLSFCFAGALTFFSAEGFYVFVGFGWLCIGAELCIKIFYKKRQKAEVLYDCTVHFQEKSIRTVGFYDTGNLARYQDVPVCFLTADLFYDLCGEHFLKEAGQVCDEMCISTVNGERRTAVYLGAITVGEEKKQVYFALAMHRISWEYQVILNGAIFQGKEGGV